MSCSYNKKKESMPIETKDYKKGYQNVIMEVQKQYNLRNKKVPINPPKKV